LVPVPDGPGEEQITEGLTARSFLIKAIFASSPAVVGLDILVEYYQSGLNIIVVCDKEAHCQRNCILYSLMI
jgi:hypothetical protein